MATSRRSARVNAALFGAAFVAVYALEHYASTGVDRTAARGLEGRQLADEDSAYDGATRTLQETWDRGEWQCIVTLTLILVLGSLAAGAGVGGGGLFVPIYWLILDAGPKGAVPLSKATILGGALGNFLSLGFQRHPKANRPMIDYEASTFMQSGELLGVVFGVLLNKLLPAILIILFLIAILGWNSVRTVRKGIAIRKKETAAFAKAAAAKDAGPKARAADDVEPGTQGNSPPSSDAGSAAPGAALSNSREHSEAVRPNGVAIDVCTRECDGDLGTVVDSPKMGDIHGYGSFMDLSSADDLQAKIDVKKAAAERQCVAHGHVTAPAETTPPVTDPAAVSRLDAILREESKQFPCWAWGTLACMTGFTLSHGFVSRVISKSDDCQDWAWWLWYVTPVPVLSAFMAGTAIYLGKKHAEKVAVGYKYLEADIQWSKETLKKFPLTALMAGVTAGLLGIGGGMVIGPLFLSIGMEPQVGTSSCAFMILWTACSGVVLYISDERLGWQLMCVCVSVGFVSGQLGQRLVNTVLKKTGRPSYVVFLLGAIIGTATVAMAAGMIVKFAQGDFNADGDTEPGEPVFYIGSGFGCDSDPGYAAPNNSSANASAAAI